jgi:hypothetical protein
MRVDQIEMLSSLYRKASKDEKFLLEKVALIMELPVSLLKSGLR